MVMGIISVFDEILRFAFNRGFVQNTSVMNEEQESLDFSDVRKSCRTFIDYTCPNMDRKEAGRIKNQNPSMENFLFQFSSEVVDFSSQYGSDISISYTASNVTGRPSKFPSYGDFPQSYVMVSFQ